jgi:hypothetical protein
MTNLPKPLEAWVGGVGLTCCRCGQKVVEAVAPEDGEPYVCPSCATPLPLEEDALTRAALSDPDAFAPPPPRQPTVWRPLFLIALAVLALGLLFTRR